MNTQTRRRWMIMLLVITLVFSIIPCRVVLAADYSAYALTVMQSKLTMYTGNQLYQSASICYSVPASDESRAKIDKIQRDLVWTTDNQDVVGFLEATSYDETTGESIYHTKSKVKGESYVTFVAKAQGTAVITITSKLLDTSLKINVKVKYAELTNNYEVFYDHNTYDMTMSGNASSVTYTSSNQKVAKVDTITGKVTTLKSGTTTIACEADDGKIYTYKMQVKKRGLSYTKLTSYYFTGFAKGFYTEFPLVAAGIQVKSWKSSDTKVCKVENHGSLGVLQTTGTGTCTITCTAKDGQKYICKLTVVGGTKWSGLGGYQPKLSELKKHGYYNDINSIMDYGDVIVAINDYANEIDLKNGNKKMKTSPGDSIRQTIIHRFGFDYANGGGDYVIAKQDQGSKIARIWLSWYYKK